jgi:hypothetical protein
MEYFTDLAVVSRKKLYIDDYQRELQRFKREKHEIAVDSLYLDQKVLPQWRGYEPIL